MTKVLGPKPGGGGGGHMHFKVGGGGIKHAGRGAIQSRVSGGMGEMSGLPPKAANPYKKARLQVNRAIGTAKMPKGGVY